jgi:hypothetical protein
MNHKNAQTFPSAIVSPHKGGAILFQGGMLTQALALPRSDIGRFLLMPSAVDPLVIPAFASAGLACYATTGEVDFISIHRHPDDPNEYSVVIKLKHGDHIVYYSHPANAEGPEALAARGVTVVITPRSIATVHKDRLPGLKIVASLPRTQQPDLTAIYAVEMELLRAALEEALTKTLPHDEN